MILSRFPFRFIILSAAVTVTWAFAIRDVKEELVGKWKLADERDNGSFTFDREGFIVLEVNGKVTGGRDFLIKGKRAQLLYEVDADSIPYEIDIISREIETGVEKRLLGIFEFQDSTNLRLALEFNPSKGRPVNFDEAKILTKEN